MMQDTKMNDLAQHLSRSTLEFCVRSQGRRSAAETGEEPGKIPHGHTGVRMRGLLTTNNGVNETLFFLVGLRKFLDLTRDEGFVEYGETFAREMVLAGCFEDP